MNAKSDGSPPQSTIRRWLLPSWEQRKQALHREAWTLLVLTYAALAFGYFFPSRISDEHPVAELALLAAFMLRTFTFHIGAAVAAAALIAYFARARRLALAALPLALLTLAPSAWSLIPKRPAAANGPTVRVMAVNLLAFNRDVGEIVGEVAAADPDVVLFQEFTPGWQRAMLEHVGERYPHRFEELHAAPDCFGIGIWSKRPFVGLPFIFTLGESDEPLARAVIEIDGRPVAFHSVHLVPPSSRFGVREQRRETADLIERIAQERLPCVFAGDFNFTPESDYHARLMAAGMQDAFDLAGCGRGDTWPVKRWTRYVPGLRLDHIYLSRELTAAACKTGVGMGSDHRPVVADIGFSADRPR